MNNSPRIALGKSDASLLRTIPEFRLQEINDQSTTARNASRMKMGL